MVKISIIQGDITKIKADVIVNSAHESLSPGSGVCGAIHLASGLGLKQECEDIIKKKGKNLSIGEAVLTSAYNLEKNGVKFIIHTLTPRAYSDKMSDLWACYENSLEIAKKNGCKSIVFPALATGAHGLDMKKSAWHVRRFLSMNRRKIEEVILVLSNKKDKMIYEEIILPLDEHKGVMDFANFCPICLGPTSSCLGKNICGFFCSEECAEKGGCYSKKNEDVLNKIISDGLKAQKRNDIKK